jgi:RNA-directed DNA polymerase
VSELPDPTARQPIFEADFAPCSYGFRPNRRAHDAMAETRFLASKTYEWVLEGDITACFDEISHPALMDWVRVRIADKRVLALVKAFLKTGVLSVGGATRETVIGTPQGGITSPLLANIALSVLDEHIAKAPGGARSTTKQRWTRRQKGLPNYRLIRYADLCRARHKSAYAEARVMPMLVSDWLFRAVDSVPPSA